MYCMHLFDILVIFPFWSLAMNPYGLCTDIKTIFFFLFLGSWVGTEIALCILSVLSDFRVILAGRPHLDFMVFDLVNYCVCFM